MREIGSETPISMGEKQATLPLLPPEALKAGVDAPPPDLLEQFAQYETQIRELYAQVDTWHGLGRYNVIYEDTDRTTVKEVQDTLTNVLEIGILPQPDNFQERLHGRGAKSTSVTYSRPYASIYAYIHDVGKRVKYRFHNSFHWGKVTALAALKNYPGVVRDEWQTNGFKGVNETRPRPFRKGKSKDIENWKKKVVPELSSDDYPIFIGIQQNAFTPVRTSMNIRAYHEQRSHEVIPISKFTHIEVPLEKMEEVQSILDQRGIETPLIPIEMGEVYSSKFNSRDLVRKDVFKIKYANTPDSSLSVVNDQDQPLASLSEE
jgi:hypothetical protein